MAGANAVLEKSKIKYRLDIVYFDLGIIKQELNKYPIDGKNEVK